MGSFLEDPDGQVALSSPFYIERPPIERDCYETIVKPTALIRIKAPRQMGKSSLVSRILQYSQQQGYHTVYLNFQLIDQDFISNLSQFLQCFCTEVADELGLEDKLDKYWTEKRGSKISCTNYFQRYILSELQEPVVLGLDEVDQIFQYPEVAVDFFGLLRAWHEKGKNEPRWQKLRLVISHSKEVYIPLNINQSPFNVGFPVELPELTTEQVKDLAERHSIECFPEEIDSLMNLLGGHPYLIRVAFYCIAKGEFSIKQLLKVAPMEEGPYYDHLRRHLRNVQHDEELMEATKKVISASNSVKLNSIESFKLRSMGLVKFQGNEVIPFCNLYRLYFQEHLGKSNSQKNPASGADDTTLAAIVFTDVVNSTALMVADQKGMRDLLNRDFTLMAEICQKHQGQLLKNLGDGLLMYFSSAVKAVLCTLEIQKSIADKSPEFLRDGILSHRIGIHVGDVFLSGGDVLGAGVNIAARLQSQAQPGGICISQMVYDSVKDHLELQVQEMEPRQLKGIPYVIPLYEIIP